MCKSSINLGLLNNSSIKLARSRTRNPDKRGEVVARSNLDQKRGKVHTMVNSKRYTFTVHTSLGELQYTKELFRFSGPT